jgi:probable F420-dependent oxidoreductase
MEFGLQVLPRDFKELRDTAQAAEQLGYDLILFPDHIVYEQAGGSYDPHTAAYDQMVSAAVVFEATKRIRAGHLVLCNLFRHPVITAQSLMTLDNLSGGRLVAGLGTGWTEREFRMTGMPFPPIATRLRMLDEALTCIRSLWTKDETTFQGEFYRLKDAILWPKPVQKPHPPILIGGGGRGLLRIAAKHAETVNIISEVGKAGRIEPDGIKRTTDDNFKDKVSFLRQEASKNRRSPGAIRISNVLFFVMLVNSPNEAEATAKQMAQGMGVQPAELLHSPLALIGTAEQCAAELGRRIREWGISQFIFSGGFTGSDLKTIERIAKEVIPHVKG